MKRLLILCVFIATLFSFSFSVAAVEAFDISSYNIQMKVFADNSYQITETINVSFNEMRHGIIRKIPTKTYYNKNVKIKNVNVPYYNFEISRQGGNLEVKIGDKDKYAEKNENYEISYLYKIGYDYNDKTDELYFNLIGTGWDTSIKNVTFTIEMPYEFDASKLNFTYGQAGSTQNTDVEYKIQGKVITGKLKKALSPNEALTIALPLNEGYFNLAKKDFLIEDVIFKYYPVIFLLLVFLSAYIWYKKGKPKKIFQTVEFYAPEGTTPADVGYIIDGRVDTFDVTSLIIYWADKGYLKIRELEDKKHFELTKLMEIPDYAKDYEKDMFNALFDKHGNGQTVSTSQLETVFYTDMANTISRVNQSWTNDKKGTRIYSKSNLLTRFVIGVCSFLIMFFTVWSIYFKATAQSITETGEVLVILSVAALLTIIPSLILFENISRLITMPRNQRLITMLISITFNIIAVMAFIFVSILYSNLTLTLLGVLSLYLTMALNYNCIRRTKMGDMYMQKLLGFRSFLETAEKERIEMLVEQNPQYFYNVLPYALVLGVTDKWAKKFEHITTNPPNWYQTNGNFTTLVFINSLNNNMRSMDQTLNSRPAPQNNSSGGSFGGGFSGGGSGGGGGGSW